ncbi:thioesterase domain-containing protein [Chitinophaga solisilvae]|uniref:thioesterase domain-containing protein n=1 Tax=Chitinophaga solisilvae TaxID=1233460 RepID=UPI00136BB094|nr:thioesterase domain-containing protein [Chitinophaga solisilvae]
MKVKLILQALQAGGINVDDALKSILALNGQEANRQHAFTPDNIPHSKLTRLNNAVSGRPVFWLHSGMGGIEPYIKLMQSVPRPVWLLQPKEQLPPGNTFIPGIPAIAARYLEVIRAIQPEGPYEFGGFSLGGVIACEIIRQLQEQGEKISSVVMIDPPSDRTRFLTSYKDLLLKMVNSMLFSRAVQHPEESGRLIIRRNEVDTHLDDSAFLQQLITLALQKGFRRQEASFKEQVMCKVQLLLNYRVDHYILKPLPQPEEVPCYFFYNRNEIFYGEMELWFCLKPEPQDMKKSVDWRDWKAVMPDFHLLNLEAPNHLLLMYNQHPIALLTEFCELLYDREYMTAAAFSDFVNKSCLV